MSDNLSENQEIAKSLMPSTSRGLASGMGVGLSYVYDVVEGLRAKGYDVAQDSDGRYFIPSEHETDDGPVHVESSRQTSSSKATKTRKAKKTLAEMEHNLKETLKDTDPAIARGGLDYTDGNQDLIIHRTDDHFGELVTNQHGERVFDSEVAEARVRKVFDESLALAEKRRDLGVEFDNVHLLLGGDIVTNEAIYEGQPHEIDETLHEQIDRAADVYIDSIQRLSDEFPTVQVVCQPGNHGRMGSGNPTNADSILYTLLDKVVRQSEMENVTFLQSDRSYYINFNLREWDAHLRHGHDRSLEHIGTSAGKQRWQSWMIDHGFDVAFRGHYHMLKEEPVNGVPVVMGGSIVPQTEFEESQAMSGRAIAAIHGTSDEYPLEWTDRITFD